MSYAELAQQIAAETGITFDDHRVERTCAVVQGDPIERDGIRYANNSPGAHEVAVIVSGVPLS